MILEISIMTIVQWYQEKNIYHGKKISPILTGLTLFVFISKLNLSELVKKNDMKQDSMWIHLKRLKDSKKSAKHREDNSQIVLAVINGVGSIVSTRNCCIIVSPIGVGFLVPWNLGSYLTWKNCLYGHSNWQKRSEKIRNKPTERRTDIKKKEGVQYSC